MTFAIDTRWGTSLDTKVPETAVAAYGARWIDHDTWVDVVPDRQGLSYNSRIDRDKLIACMQDADLQKLATLEPYDMERHIVDDFPVGFHCWVRRSGGYFYVCAWLEDF